MEVMDEFKKEREKQNEMSLRDKIDNFIYYHKVAIILSILIVIIAVMCIYTSRTNKDIALYVALIDCHDTDFVTIESERSYENILAEQLNLNTKKYRVELDNSFYLGAIENPGDESVYSLPERLYLRLVNGNLDAFVAEEDTINAWVMNDGFLDLREEMTPEQYEYYKNSFYWVDYDVIKDYELSFDDGAYIYDTNHRSPEGMKNPMPVGVYITPNESFQEYYRFIYEAEVVYCLTYAGKSEDIAKEEYNSTKLALDYLDIISGRITPTGASS